MKNYNKYILLFGSFVFSLLFSACSDFEETNTNPHEMTDEQGVWDDYAIGGAFLTMQRSVTVVGTQSDATDIINQYQIAYHLSADTWAGYFGQNNNWYSGNSHMTNYLVDNWINASYRNTYTVIYPSWKKIKDKPELQDYPEYFALAQILKISAWHKTTDMFGPIPYLKAGGADLTVPYDSQKDVYQGFFDDLEKAIAVLTEKANVGVKIIPDYDAIYAGNSTNWVKYANSLMLRLAMRVRFADAEMAKKYAEMAVNHPIGVMTVSSDEAKISQLDGLAFRNNIQYLAQDYGESRMGSSMLSYLFGYKDPRLSAYFSPSTSQFAVKAFDGQSYQAVPTGHLDNQNDTYKSFSLPNFKQETPTYWMRASEVYFLRAEGALIGWNMGGEAASLYEQGIAISFEENGIAADLANSYMTSGNVPVEYVLNSPSYKYSADAPTTETAEFNGSQDQKLEKIMIQKWIALFPNGQEAWSEWRRTGFPKLHKVNNDRGNLGAAGVRRLRYPTNAYNTDPEGIAEALILLGGDDKPSTKLWWDAK